MIKSFSFNEISKELNNAKIFIISICSMLGVGIFLKSKTLIALSQRSILPILALFSISVFLVISMCLAFTRLIDKSTKSSRGFIEWVEQYCGTDLSNWVLSFTTKLLHPLGILTTSIYLVKWVDIPDYLGIWVSCVFALLISVLIISLNVFSFKFAVLLQKVLSFSIFLSILYTLGFGIHSYFSGGNQLNNKQMQSQNTGLNGLSGWTIIFSGLPSIFFMYDGFYSVLSLKERAKQKTSFKKIISLSFIVITLIYFLMISITLLGEGKDGDFMKFIGFKNKTFKNLSIALIFLTFLSSLNVASICGQNQLIQMHYKYNFKEFNSIKEKYLSLKNKLKFSLESKLTIWIYLIKQIMVLVLIIVAASQLISWIFGIKDPLMNINEILAELNSLIIFGVLGKILWNSRKGKKINYFASIGIFFGIIYFLFNNAISLVYSYQDRLQTNSIAISLLRLLIFLALLIYPAQQWIRRNISERTNCENFCFHKFNKLNQEYSLIRWVSK